MKRIILIRHAEAVSNHDEKNKEKSPEDTLTEHGIQQVRVFTQNYTGSPSLIVSSQYPRAIETATLFAEKFSRTKFEVWEGIQEFHYLRGGVEEKKEQKKSFWNRNDPVYKSDKDLESFSEFVFRIDAFLNKLTVLEDDEVVIFSHAKFMRMVIVRLTHYNNVEHKNMMKSLKSNMHRFNYCDSMELGIEGKGRDIYIKDMRESS